MCWTMCCQIPNLFWFNSFNYVESISIQWNKFGFASISVPPSKSYSPALMMAVFDFLKASSPLNITAVVPLTRTLLKSVLDSCHL